MVTAELRLLGPPALIAAGRRARLHSTKTLALLAYLVLEAEALHSREKLAGLLWGESQEARARQSLRQALYSLRRVLGSVAQACLVVEEGTAAFQPCPDFWVDALEFLSFTSAGPKDLDALRRAAYLYKGLLLEGVELPNCPIFEEWLFFQRDALEQQILAVLQKLADGLIHQGAYQEALAFAQQWIRLDPLHERAHRRLMQIHATLGDRDGVRRQYRLCADILTRELGVEPSAETEALYHQLTAVKAEPIHPPERLPAPQPVGPPPKLPFLGRESELAALQTCLDQAIAGQGGLLLIAGEAGMGKTRLITEFVSHSQEVATAQAVPTRWLSGRCYRPEARAPYTMWSDALHPLVTADWQPLLTGLPTVWRQQLARLVPELTLMVGDIEGATAAESRLRLLQGVVQCLACLTQSATLLLFFDDLHWADEASLELLHYAVRHLAGYPLLIIGTYRPEAAIDNPHLNHLLSEASDIAAPPVLRLKALDREMVGRLLVHLGLELPSDLPDRFHQHSGGNPFVLLETLRTLLELGHLKREPDGRLIEVRRQGFPVSQRVQDLIRTRLATLNEEQRRVLNAAAVIGRPFSLPLLRRVSGQPEPQLLDLVAQLLARSFLQEKDETGPHKSLGFQHNYFRQVIYQELGAVQRQVLHRRVAQALLARHRTRLPAIIEEVAHHYEQAGDAQAVTYLVQAAQQAEQLFAFAHAVELYSRALTFHRLYLTDEPASYFDLLLAREAVLDRQGRRAEQADDVAALVKLAGRLGDTNRQAIAYLRQVGFFAYTGRHEAARQAGKRALDLYRQGGDKAGEAQALRELGFLHWSTGDYGTALTYNRDALQLHRQLGDVSGEATALHNLAEIHRGLGSPRQALAQYEQALNLYWARQDQRRQGLTFYGMAHALHQMEQTDKALARYQQALDLFQVAGDRLMISRVHHTLAGLQWEAGALDRALNHMHQALSISQEIGYGAGIAHGLIALSYLYAQCDEAATAREYLQEAITWLRLIEDQAGLFEAQTRLQALKKGALEALNPPLKMGWVKNHVALAEGKVYCEFESPMAHR